MLTKSYEQGIHEQLQQEIDLNIFHDSNVLEEPTLKQLPECTAQLGSDFGAMALTPLQVYPSFKTQNSALNDPLPLHRSVREAHLPSAYQPQYC